MLHNYHPRVLYCDAPRRQEDSHLLLFVGLATTTTHKNANDTEETVKNQEMLQTNAKCQSVERPPLKQKLRAALIQRIEIGMKLNHD
jgi:hypothetical protein